MATTLQPDVGGSQEQVQPETLDRRFNDTGFEVYDSNAGKLRELDSAYIGSTDDQTKVDIVTVPCPGADRLLPWIGSDPFAAGHFLHSGDAESDTNNSNEYSTLRHLAADPILSPAIHASLNSDWVRHGIPKYASTARVLLYKHPTLSEDVSLESLADDLAKDLIENVLSKGDKERPRPLFFAAHSIGGLVVKLLLVRASKDSRYRLIKYSCHGVAFFATPHRGSSYLSMRGLSESIKKLLHLEQPLPHSIADELRLDHKPLLRLNDSFRDISSELRIWTFYETLDSWLSGTGSGTAREVQFGAPLASIKSSILDIWQEDVFAVESDHADCGSFGRKNPRTMKTFLDDLSKAVAKAAELSKEHKHHPMNLKDTVKLDLVGFYPDPDAEGDSALRLYFAGVSLTEFLYKGPEECFRERLQRAAQPGPHDDTRPGTANTWQSLGPGSLSDVQNIAQHPPPEAQAQGSERPEIVVSEPRPPAHPGVHWATMPEAAMRQQGLAVAHGSPEHHRPLSRASNASDFSTHSAPLPEGHAGSRTEAGFRRGSDDYNRLASQDMAGFSRPDPDSRKFMWIHLPFTNPLWVKSIFNKISETHIQSFASIYNSENWLYRQIQGHPSQPQPNYVKQACNYIPADAAQPSAPSHGPNYLYLYMPYLHFDRYAKMVRRRKLVQKRLKHGRAGPVPQETADLDSLELKVIWKYIGADPPLNCRRTLDQFGYPSLQKTQARDDDQMLYKLTKERPPKTSATTKLPKTSKNPGPKRADTYLSIVSPTAGKDDESSSESDVDADDDDDEDETNLKDGNVLMVDQLWLWAIDKETLLTFFPRRESSPKEGTLFQQADLRNSVYNELNGDLTGRTDNALDLAAFIVLHAVTALLDRSSHPDLEIFRIFEEAIGKLTEKMTESLKRFRTQTFKGLVTGLSSSGSASDENTKSIKSRYKEELQRAQRENRENTSALLELRDMEDELTTLSRLFEAQEAVVKSLSDIPDSHPSAGLTDHGQGYLKHAQRHLDAYKSTTSEMLKRVETTRKDYEKLLEMAQRQAQVDDVRWSRIQTELAQSQNMTVMIFTIVTVIFLPLSFFTGLFGMNTREWQASGSSDDGGKGGGGGLPSLSYIGSISLPVSFFLIVISLVAAFSERMHGWFSSVYRLCRRGSAWWRQQVLKVTPQPLVARKMKREADRKRRAKRKRERSGQGSYDFWEKMRQEESYTIPETNKKGTGDGAGGKKRKKDRKAAK